MQDALHEKCTYDLAGVTSGVTMSVGQATAGAPMSATVKVLGPTTIMKQVKDSSSVGSVLPSRTGTAVMSLQPVLIRPGTAMTVVSTPSSSQTSTIQASLVAASRTSTGLAATSSSAASAASNMQPLPAGVQQTVQDIVQQAQAQAARQNTAGIVTTSTASFPQQAPAASVGSPSPLSVGPVTTVTSAADVAAAAAVAAASQNKSSPYVTRLRNQRS